MEYKYVSKGKCNDCGQICWVDKNAVSIDCGCYNMHLSYIDSDNINVIDITDEEFKTVLRLELNIPNDTPITLIHTPI
jgi:hypothetical protein